jgi:hypothetical protein
MEPKYYLDGDEFVIENYNQAKPFASFLPGIAGLGGKPLWAFYVNRGQCMASFGQTSKEGAIMEFYPANTSYRRAALEGFRTFVKSDGSVHEPFTLPRSAIDDARAQKMHISMHELRIEETDKKRGLRFEAVYFTIPNENFPALGRILSMTNISKEAKELEVIDGMPKICPFGSNEFFMKHMSRTIEAWMEVACLDEGTPFYRLRVDAADTSETKYITSGNFYLSRLARGPARPAVIVDPRAVFGDFQDLTWPGGFASKDLCLSRQLDKNITPSAFSYCKISLAPGATESVLSLTGHAASVEELKDIDRAMSTAFFEDKRDQNRDEIASRASSVSVFSGVHGFDLYARQTNLDNILRGGIPINVKGSKKIAYVFNRKHGDLERDYNNFTLNPEFYSQGNGNFRDTNQNRRMSVWLNPAVAEKDIRDFYNLIQLDGYNPLIVKGDKFSVKDNAAAKRLAKKYFGKKEIKAARVFLSGLFTLGELIKFSGSNLAKDEDGLIGEVIDTAVSRIEAEHGEGFWTDHWTYNLDLVESYLALYPERQHELLFRDREYAFFDNAHRVKPRSQRIVPNPEKKARQYHGVVIDEEKKRLIASRRSDPTWVRAGRGKGDIYKCTLAAKMLVLIANKIATLDPAGIGIEMEADKPAWCDSLNGLPALMGSSLSETLELARLVKFLKTAFADAACVSVPCELASFIRGLTKLLSKDAVSGDRNGNFRYWDRSNALKEKYRADTRLGVTGKEKLLEKEAAMEFLAFSLEKLEDGIKRGCDRTGVPYTYFVNDLRSTGKGRAQPPVSSRPLPLFLEAPVHAMKLTDGLFDARSLYSNVRASALYDRDLGMYKLNASLEKEPLEIGRSRVFTPGWLENESVWLHMEYKFLLEALKNGLYDEFYRDLKTALIPFQDPARYGRSTLENSSFITCSAFFDENMRGNGFVARLSGATAEFLQMLLIMNIGKRPFLLKGGELIFCPSPALEGAFFTDKARDIEFDFKSGKRKISLKANSYAFSLFRHTLVIFNNPKRKDTFGPDGVKPAQYRVSYAEGKENVVDSAFLGEPYTKDLRAGLIETISIALD